MIHSISMNTSSDNCELRLLFLCIGGWYWHPLWVLDTLKKARYQSDTDTWRRYLLLVVISIALVLLLFLYYVYLQVRHHFLEIPALPLVPVESIKSNQWIKLLVYSHHCYRILPIWGKQNGKHGPVYNTHFVSFRAGWSFQANMALLSFGPRRPQAATGPLWPTLTNLTKRPRTTLRKKTTRSRVQRCSKMSIMSFVNEGRRK